MLKKIELLIGILAFVIALVLFYRQPDLNNTQLVFVALGALVTIYSQRDRIRDFITPPEPTPIIETTCGDRPLNLADQRLHISLTFGAYFTSLLEKEALYTPIPGQLVCAQAASSPIKDPLQYAMWTLIDAKGARILLLAAEGGMGKSTLASKLIRCLYEREDIDMILGDSAKQYLVNPVTGHVDTTQPGYYSAQSFLERISAQLGLVYDATRNDAQHISTIQDRLIDRRAIIVVDNLESVRQSDRIIQILNALVNRRIRAIITTRIATGFDVSQSQMLTIQVKSLTEHVQVRNFMQWHIQQYMHDHPRLHDLAAHLPTNEQISWLIHHSGGIPLLVQVLLSEIARTSWMSAMNRTNLFGQELLDALYFDHWHELSTLSTPGMLARTILEYVNREAHHGDRITYRQLVQLAEDVQQGDILDAALALLHERFLIINNDKTHGNFSIYPSLSDFIQTQLLTE